MSRFLKIIAGGAILLSFLLERTRVARPF